MLYALLGLLLSLLAAACAGFSATAPATLSPPVASAPPVVLTPPPTRPPTAGAQRTPTPALTLTLPPSVPVPNPTAAPDVLPPTPTPIPTPAPALTSQLTLAPAPGLPPHPPNQRIPYVQVTAGKRHACALRADGVAHCWGDNAYGKTYVPARMRFRHLSAGLHFTCGLRYEGDIACWGDGRAGQTNPPPGLFTQLAAGRQHACALDAAGAALCWGTVASPAADFAFKAVSSGLNYSCGLTTADHLECWGKDRVTGAHAGPFTALSAGLHHVCALRPNGAAACYGINLHYQSAPPETAFVAIAAGWHHSCGITRADRTLECWGAGRTGAVGQRLAAPAGVFTALSSGWQHNCALRPNGAAQCWHQPNPDRSAQPTANLTTAFGGRVFDLPVELFPWPAGGLAVVEKSGAITAYYDHANAAAADGNGNGDGAGAANGAAPRPILDLTDRIDTLGERGLVSAALDPNFDQFPFLYVYYHQRTELDIQAEGRLARFPVVDGAAVHAAEVVILTLPKMHWLHLGGAIRFGPDGMLYLGIGDNETDETAPDLASPHGKILRIDVRDATPEQPYRIPPDNPFATTPGALPEIWAYGLRNPWRMDFDAAGNLWVADVGFLSVEEISIATAGANLGWPTFEGNLCQQTATECAALQDTATAPVFTYPRSDDQAIIGGIANPTPEIAYLFGDYSSQRIWALERDPAADTGAGAGWRRREIAQANGRILAFGTGAAGEVFVLLLNRPILRLQW